MSLYGQTAADTLYAVDLYGLRSVSEAAVRPAVGVRAGDPVPVSLEPIRARVRAIAAVAEVDVSAVCCSENGRTMLYVGVREPGTHRLSFRAPPTGASAPQPLITKPFATGTNSIQLVNCVHRWWIISLLRESTAAATALEKQRVDTPS